VAHSQAALGEETVDEAIGIAIRHQQHGRLAEAQAIYDGILARLPDHPAALHYAGILKHQRGDTVTGIQMLQRSIGLEPRNGDAYTNLGNLLKSSGQLAPAIAAYLQAIALNPGDANAFSNLGIVLRAQGRLADAEAVLRKAIELAPEHPYAYLNLGTLLSGQERYAEAIEYLVRTIALAPHNDEARRCLGFVYCRVGERGKAADLYARWLGDQPDNAFARHMLAACSGRDVPDRAAEAFVEQLFDDFAPRFDDQLKTLSYRAPELIAARLANLGIAATKSLEVLDAGCGTGLCGPLLAPYARRLVGVDLSAQMLAGAQQRRVYDELVKAEITRFITECPAGSFDLVVSADTLVYFGALEAMAAAAAQALKRPGRLLFTVERGGAEAAAKGYALEPHGRYSHDEEYVCRTLAATGFTVTIDAAELRMEAGRAVAGLLVTAEVGTAPELVTGPPAARIAADAPVATHEIAGESHD
jgi:predicted TPR repeat methyltransferase